MASLHNRFQRAPEQEQPVDNKYLAEDVIGGGSDLDQHNQASNPSAGGQGLSVGRFKHPNDYDIPKSHLFPTELASTTSSNALPPDRSKSRTTTAAKKKKGILGFMSGQF